MLLFYGNFIIAQGRQGGKAACHLLPKRVILQTLQCMKKGGKGMLRFVRRGGEESRPVGDYPPWLSTLLRTRGMDTPEKAQRFLHPALEQLHPPLMMQDMDRRLR